MNDQEKLPQETKNEDNNEDFESNGASQLLSLFQNDFASNSINEPTNTSQAADLESQLEIEIKDGSSSKSSSSFITNHDDDIGKSPQDSGNVYHGHQKVGRKKSKLFSHRQTFQTFETSSLLSKNHEKMIASTPKIKHGHYKEKKKFQSLMTSFILPNKASLTSTFIGSTTSIFYHVVFALALASAVSHPPLLSPLAKMATLSSFVTGPILTYVFRNDIPSLYPTLDLFVVPFLVQFANIINNVSSTELSTSKNDEMQKISLFLNTFAILTAIGMGLSGLLCFLASKFKLANIGVFLPYSVLCGFFSSIAILIWTIAFSIDNNGMTIQQLFTSPTDSEPTIDTFKAFRHHIPSLLAGLIMFHMASKNSAWILRLVCISAAIVYIVLIITGTSLEQAQEIGWFWKHHDFDNDTRMSNIQNGFAEFYPPAPFGILHALFSGNFYLDAVIQGLPTVCAMAFIFAIRCSIHAIALKRNRSRILSILDDRQKDNTNKTLSHKIGTNEKNISNSYGLLNGKNQFSSYDNNLTNTFESNGNEKSDADIYRKNKFDVLNVLKWYGYAHAFSGILGGYAVLPNLGVAPTLAKQGAEKPAPQFGGAILLLVFYLTNFKAVQYIPKITFSSLLILCFLDLFHNWFIKSFKTTKNKYEWMVVPIIICFTFMVGMLESVALGIAISTFIFVASFYKTGVVKYIDTGLIVRSTIERNAEDASWLDQNGDLIQVIVLQNYLFFGNTSSCLDYISSMFEDVRVPQNFHNVLPPKPKYLVIDFSLCSGMDTSAVSVFVEACALCKQNQCKIIFSSVSRDMKEMMKFGGELSTKGGDWLEFAIDLEAALGDAEDGILSHILHRRKREMARASQISERNREVQDDFNGFLYALMQIDDQHGTEFGPSLQKLSKYTVPVELQENDNLFDHKHMGGVIDESERGLFFIEHGLMTVERDPSYTLSRSARSMNNLSSMRSEQYSTYDNSIGHYNARAPTIGKQGARIKSHFKNRSRKSHSFRLARIGPGWVIGGLESCADLRNPGIYKAITKCRLHHLPLAVIEELEIDNPGLVLNLFKMISHLMARRQNVTIEQLATLQSIIANPPLKKPMNRLTIGVLNNVNSLAD